MLEDDETGTVPVSWSRLLFGKFFEKNSVGLFWKTLKGLNIPFLMLASYSPEWWRVLLYILRHIRTRTQINIIMSIDFSYLRSKKEIVKNNIINAKNLIYVFVISQKPLLLLLDRNEILYDFSLWSNRQFQLFNLRKVQAT